MIDTTKFFFNKDQHIALAENANTLADSKNVTVSRWVNNSKGRQIVTYIIHTGERNAFASKQENVLFSINEDSGRGGKIYDESAMLNAVIQFLNSIIIETEPVVEFINISERYGNPEIVTISDYEELNPAAEFAIEGDKIVEFDPDTKFSEVVARRHQIV